MTVTYSLHVAKARLSGFPKLLLRWKGSIYKLLYKEMVIFCALYYGLLILYRLILNDVQRRIFEKLAIYCEAFTDLIPLSFVLGFYVTIVVSRWWNQYLAIPWPDKTCMLISAHVHGNDERGRIIRRTLARYLSLMSALTFQAVSTAVKKRFPTVDHLVEAGLMTKEEHRVYDELQMVHGKWWVPAQWFTSLAVRARKEGRIKDYVPLKHLLDEMHTFRGNCGLLFSYDWISIPLVYTQVVTLAIYTYFLATVMGKQYLDPKKGYPGHDIDLYIPVFTILQFFFYMGWLKVAEQLINPFGEDDDDFELNWCLDRNLQLSFNVVDEMHQVHPRLIKDMYWDDLEPQLPYTKLSFNLRTQPHLGSAVNLDVNPNDTEFITMETIMEEDKDENNYNTPPRSPSHEYHDGPFFQHFSNPPKKHCPSNANSNDSSSLARLKLPDLPKIMNMVIGSNRELNQSFSEDVTKDCSNASFVSVPFVLKSPIKKNCSNSTNPETVVEEKPLLDETMITLLPSHEELVPARSSIYLSPLSGEISDHCSIDMPMRHSEEESPHIESKHCLDPGPVQGFGNIESGNSSHEVGESKVLSLADAVNNDSRESLTSSDSSQSTVNSYSELLEHEI